MSRPVRLDAARIDEIVARIRAGRPVRRSMSGWGRLHIDRPLPFLVVYRRPRAPDAGTERLAVGVASYLLADSDPRHQPAIGSLIERIATEMQERFGAFLIIEIWADTAEESLEPVPRPAYRVLRWKSATQLDPTVVEIATALRESRILRQEPVVDSDVTTRLAPPRLRPLLSSKTASVIGADLLGIAVRPVYRDAEGAAYPVVLRQMGRRMATALDRGAYRFTHTRTTARPVHHHALGRRSAVKAVWDIDHALAEIGEAFDPLLQVTPVNAEQAWTEFRRSRFQRRPSYLYRPLPFDPGRMKHRLWSVRPERVEDPTLMYLFRDTQHSLDRQISLMAEIERPEFMHTSLQMHGGVEPGLLALAQMILESHPRSRRTRAASHLTAFEFAGLATSEIQSYRESHPHFGVAPQVRDDMYAGLMVSRGRMYVGSAAHIPCARADALLQHEVGTHMVTYYNGRHQPLRLLAIGLPGYDELQEGLAVLGEYLVGGLDAERLRVLAARVIAVHSMIEGAEFVDTWRLLRDHGFTQRSAFTIATRVYRGGGLAKDAMYLRGLAGILDYVAEGCAFDRLFVGKFAVKHMPVVDELLLREVLSPPLAVPRYLQRTDAAARLVALGTGITVTDLVRGRVRSA